MKTPASIPIPVRRRGIARGPGAALILALFGAALHPATAGLTIYSTSFENPPFAAGSQLLGQDGWSTAIPPFLNPDAPTITNTSAVSGTQSVQVRGADMIDAAEVDPYAAVGSYRRPLNFDSAAAGLPFVLLQSSVRLDGPALGTGDFFTANFAARIGDGFAGELSLSSDGFAYGYDGSGDETRLFTTPVTLNAWHTFGIQIDFAAKNYSFLVDGTSSGLFPFQPGSVSDVLVRESLVVYANKDSAPNFRSAFTARFDDVSAIATPEPASALMLALGGVGLLSRRRRAGKSPLG